MPLIPSLLAQNLTNGWLPQPDGPFAESADASADALASAIADWFGQAMAAGFPCSTAAARRSQLKGQLLPALQAQDAQAAGQMIALGFMAYVAGQSFGAGVAAPPLATAAAGSLIGTALATHDLARASRADQIAQALHLAALSAIVAFPPPLPPAPVT
jgi:hypothetical protein